MQQCKRVLWKKPEPTCSAPEIKHVGRGTDEPERDLCKIVYKSHDAGSGADFAVVVQPNR